MPGAFHPPKSTRRKAPPLRGRELTDIAMWSRRPMDRRWLCARSHNRQGCKEGYFQQKRRVPARPGTALAATPPSKPPAAS